ncbi:MAG: A/G-specific adenine glycosylase [uncultured Nocardioidaceae bacterium]|uniref:Adenine DNA glycosylase n=1 Tax=uncultured Nocardioidaceae bacterium TaxID=253824 RepID=A0A6J4MMD3_9ACTN|nr:MAG: A/G-specific adenine glycosylase [uncultured Nocardioidaceae bacterium]
MHDSPDPASDRAVHPASQLHERVLPWFDAHARDLPWRSPGATAWGVLVSEFMLQQTPVVRVLPVWEAWLEAWPRAADLAAAGAGEAVRAWGRLGYPRRALRLHAAAVAILERHGGEVPESYEELLALPGVGDYTASAVASFAFGARHAVLDTNVRRVLARSLGGVEQPGASVTRAERGRAEEVLPEEPAVAARWAVAVMELGALVCTAGSPRCAACPIEDLCRWHTGGRPAYDGPARRAQTYAGTDRQCRGRLLEVLRLAEEPVHPSRMSAVWGPTEQRERCLAALVQDGLAVSLEGGGYSLP